jgi:hypothetical protein
MVLNSFFSIPVRCPQCGTNNHAQNLSCLTCGAELTPPLEPAAEQNEPAEVSAEPQSTAPEPVQDSSSRASLTESNHLAEDVRSLFPTEFQIESGESHAGRYLIVVLLVLAVAAAAWHWRGTRAIESKLLNVTASQPTASLSSHQAPASPQAVQPPPNPNSQNGTPPPAASTPAQPEASVPAPTPSSQRTSAREAEGVRPRRRNARIRPASEVSQIAVTQESEGEKYLYGDGAPVDCDRAQKNLMAAAKHSSMKAESALGSMYATGHCAIRDLPLAYRWFARAQQSNHHRDPKIAEEMTSLWNQMNPAERTIATK